MSMSRCLKSHILPYLLVELWKTSVNNYSFTPFLGIIARDETTPQIYAFFSNYNHSYSKIVEFEQIFIRSCYNNGWIDSKKYNNA